jgi:hypothetical protein
MSTRASDHAREELRALLVLGIIGTLLGVRDVLNANLGYGITLNLVANFLILYWGAYVFLMAIGISDDWVYPPICKVCAHAAQVFFGLGISVTTAVALYTLLVLLLLRFMNEYVSVIIALAVSVPLCIFVDSRISKKLPKSLEVTTK